MKLWLRAFIYLGGGGLIILWIDPPRGLGQHLVILALIVGAAYLDHWLVRHRPSSRRGGNVVSMHEVRHSRHRRQGPGAVERERRVPQTVFTSRLRQEVDDLLTLLRSEGMNPMMVSQQSAQGDNGAIYQVRLPEHELAKAKPLIQFFLVKTAKTPS